ncbi:hypothetical protein SCOR_11570 [Sulfidibacter corallicola]
MQVLRGVQATSGWLFAKPPLQGWIRAPRTTRVTAPSAPHPSLFCVVPSGRPLVAHLRCAFLSICDPNIRLAIPPGLAANGEQSSIRLTPMVLIPTHRKAGMDLPRLALKVRADVTLDHKFFKTRTAGVPPAGTLKGSNNTAKGKVPLRHRNPGCSGCPNPSPGGAELRSRSRNPHHLRLALRGVHATSGWLFAKPPLQGWIRAPRTTRVTAPSAPHPSLFCVVPSGRPLVAHLRCAFFSICDPNIRLAIPPGLAANGDHPSIRLTAIHVHPSMGLSQIPRPPRTQKGPAA